MWHDNHRDHDRQHPERQRRPLRQHRPPAVTAATTTATTSTATTTTTTTTQSTTTSLLNVESSTGLDRNAVGIVDIVLWTGDGLHALCNLGHLGLARPISCSRRTNAAAYAVAKAFNEIYPNVVINGYFKSGGSGRRLEPSARDLSRRRRPLPIRMGCRSTWPATSPSGTRRRHLPLRKRPVVSSREPRAS
ncbi:MAG: hypothetical protein MZU79_02815 [Anaerotruncus sp.]|nr:hypothetical protein [Anaerotruncus sp.]